MHDVKKQYSWINKEDAVYYASPATNVNSRCGHDVSVPGHMNTSDITEALLYIVHRHVDAKNSGPQPLRESRKENPQPKKQAMKWSDAKNIS